MMIMMMIIIIVFLAPLRARAAREQGGAPSHGPSRLGPPGMTSWWQVEEYY